jgi:putative CRISPR-associated protein (TIGR02619 family)
MNTIIFSTIGTSSLTNRNKEAGRINELSNLTENEISNEDRRFLDEQISIKRNEMENILKDINDIEKLKNFSAELNGILSYYDIKNLGKIDNQILNIDYQILLSTDTYVGKLTSELIKEILQQIGFRNICVESIDKLNTKNTENFTEGIKKLRDVIYNEYVSNDGYANYKKVFNLTGGFKSVNAYLNVLGMFYADEIIYVFETKTDLIKIPKLPIKINYEELKDLYEEFLMINTEIEPGLSDSKINKIFLFRIDNKFILNEWGEFIWEEIKDSVMKEKGLPKFDNIIYTDQVRKQFDNLETKLKELFVSRITVLSKFGRISDEFRKEPLNLNKVTDGHSEYKIDLRSNIRIFFDYDENTRKFKILSIKKHISGRYVDI